MKLRKLTKIISGLLAAVLILTTLPGMALRSGAATGTAQAIWTEGNTTLTFLVSETVYTEGLTYNGQTITKVWSGTQVTNTGDGEDGPGWGYLSMDGVESLLTKVVFENSFSSAKPKSLSEWFAFCSELTSIQGIKNLDTSSATSMAGMFAGCSALTTLDLSSFDTRKVTEMYGMFTDCTKLTKLDLSGFDVSKVVDAEDMFIDCTSLKTIFCANSDSAWTFSADYDQTCKNIFSGTTALKGRWGSTTVSYSSKSLDYAKSAKLGGYFTPKAAVISFDPNGGTGLMAAVQVDNYYYSSEGTQLPENAFTRENHDFAGWNTKADGSGTAYADKASIAPKEDITLYAQWSEHGTWTWTRLEGANRYDTAAMASAAAYEEQSMKTIIVASGQSFPDALAGSALAGVYECPILLTNSAKLSNETKAEIQRLASPDGCTVYILGGEGTVSAKVENAIDAIGDNITADRVYGTNREMTALEVYRKGLSEENGFSAGGTVIIANGYGFADVLSISPYAYAAKTPILLAKKNGSLSTDTKTLIEEEGFTKAIIIGGEGSVSEDSENYLKEHGILVVRLEGGNRYQTSAAILRWETGLMPDAEVQPEAEMTMEGMGVATGGGFPDALGSVSLLGKTHSPLLLVSDSNKTNRQATQANIDVLVAPNTGSMTKGYIFGGTGTVSTQIEIWLNAAVE